MTEDEREVRTRRKAIGVGGNVAWRRKPADLQAADKVSGFLWHDLNR